MADLKSFQRWIAEAAADLIEQADHLTELDRAIGDGDHGTNMARGFGRCAELAEHEEFGGIDAYLKKVGMTLVGTVGGASGPLYGTFFLRMAGPLSATADAGVFEVGQGLRAGVEGIVARGKAEAGDKTMYDAFAPARGNGRGGVHRRSGRRGGPPRLPGGGRGRGRGGRDATLPLVARKGRASYLGERSAGHLDPGAASAAILLRSAARALGADAR
ncbi:dihydroxyacetone kinase subunit DhaL [Ornithinimicrobium sp. W1665]|uniref:dihydroxyacetone kinase subunit DhaL n=1 Tax=Ornithinimicrobium sp. W1665 TaxID=3416666 RepID=UPI003D6A79E2